MTDVAVSFCSFHFEVLERRYGRWTGFSTWLSHMELCCGVVTCEMCVRDVT